jgi:hypothetical protein
VRIAAQALTCIESRPKSVSLASIALAVDGDIEGARELAGSGLAIGAGRLENALLHQTAGLFAELSGSPETAKSHYRSAAASPLPQYRINALISWLILSLREQDPDWQKCRDRLLDEDPAAVESLLQSVLETRSNRHGFAYSKQIEAALARVGVPHGARRQHPRRIPSQ